MGRLGSFEFMNYLKCQLYAGPNVHVVHCTNRDSSPKNLYTITLLLSHHKMLNFAHCSQIISEKAILIFTKQRFLRFFIFSFLKTFDCFITDKNILEEIPISYTVRKLGFCSWRLVNMFVLFPLWEPIST